MSAPTNEGKLISTAKEYFRRADAGRPDFVELFTEDVQIYFPKFGIGKGKQALFDLASGLMESVESISHDIEKFLYLVSGNFVTVEGVTRGVTKGGVAWSGGDTPGGRFCSIFEFRDELISRMHIYLDPDYTGDDQERFLWGHDRRIW